MQQLESGESILYFAVINDHVAIVKRIYEYLSRVKSVEEVKQFINSANDMHGHTLLHFACIYGFQDIAKYLVNTAKVDVNKRNDDGMTALDLAQQNGYNDISLFLSDL